MIIQVSIYERGRSFLRSNTLVILRRCPLKHTIIQCIYQNALICHLNQSSRCANSTLSPPCLLDLVQRPAGSWVTNDHVSSEVNVLTVPDLDLVPGERTRDSMHLSSLHRDNNLE